MCVTSVHLIVEMPATIPT